MRDGVRPDADAAARLGVARGRPRRGRGGVPEFVRQTADVLRRQGRHVEVFELEGDGGHLDGLLAIGKAGEAIRAFLAR